MNSDVDFCFLSDAMETLRAYPIGRKNVNQVVVTPSDRPLAVWRALGRLIRAFGGARWGATYNLAQAMIAGAVTINSDGFVEVYNG